MRVFWCEDCNEVIDITDAMVKTKCDLCGKDYTYLVGTLEEIESRTGIRASKFYQIRNDDDKV